MSGTTDKAQALAEKKFSNSQILDNKEKRDEDINYWREGVRGA